MEEIKVTVDMLRDVGAKLAEMDGAEDSMKALMALIEAPDDQFKTIAPGVLESYRHTLNNPNSQLLMRQALMTTGVSMEEFYKDFEALPEAIKSMENLSDAKKDFLIQLFSIMGNAAAETEGVAKRFIQIPIEMCDPNARVPQYQNVDDAGADVYATEDFSLAPGEQKIIPLGFKVACPPGYAILVHPRSGLSATTKMRVSNSPGVIDTGYRGVVGVIVENIEPKFKDLEYHFDENHKVVIDSILFGNTINIAAGQRFAQLRLVEVPKMAFIPVESVGEIGEDRNGGFGSSGEK